MPQTPEKTLSTFIAAVASQLPPDDHVVSTIGRALGHEALERATGVTNAATFCTFLDQLAACCVPGGPDYRSCVVALALSTPGKECMTMYIALNTRTSHGNATTDDNTATVNLITSQLDALWRNMQGLSQLSRDSANIGADQVDQKRSELQKRLADVVYGYSWQKLLQRANKRWPMVEARFLAVLKSRALKKGPRERRAACKTLYDRMRTLLATLRAPAANTPVGISSVVAAADSLFNLIEAPPIELLGAPGETTATEFLVHIEDIVNHGYPNDKLYLVRYVRKLLSLRFAHQVLAHSASSSLFAPWSGYPLSYHPVHTPPGRSRFQADFNNCPLLTKLVKKLIAGLPADDPQPRTPAAFIHQRIVTALTKRASARVLNVLQDGGHIATLIASGRIDFHHGLSHSEAILLGFFDVQRELGRQLVMRFFGISKLLCVPCERLLDAYNVRLHPGPGNDLIEPEFFDEPYFARGCHRLTYIPWTLPRWESSHGYHGVDTVSGSFLDRLYDLLEELLRGAPSTKTAHVSTSTVFLPAEGTSGGSSSATSASGLFSRLINRGKGSKEL